MRRLHIGLLIVLALLLPLRSLAMALPDPSAAQQEMPCHEPEPAAEDCKVCGGEGCCAVFAAVPAPLAVDAPLHEPVTVGEFLFSGFVPPHLDPPPV